MKWWYAVVLLVGVGVGWWILKNYGVGSVKKTAPVAVVGESSLKNEVAKLPTKIMTDNKGVERKTVEVQGVVQKWNPDTGIIEFISNQKLWKLVIDPGEATIFVPSLKNKDQELMVEEKSGMRWETAFCEKDFVMFKLADDKVIYAGNSGYRSCGFKGE